MTLGRPARILVVGAGAIGGYVGGMLAAAGHRVVFLCTAQTGGAIRTEGLHVSTETGDLHLRPEAEMSAEDVFSDDDIDLAIVAVKRYDTAQAVGPLAPFSDRIAHVLCLQNGLGAEAELQASLGLNRIIPGTVTTAVRRASRNRVVVERKRGIGIAAGLQGSERWVGELDGAGLNCRQYADARAMKWSKLLTNLSANPTSAILDMPPAEIYAHPGLFRLEIQQLREALAVMKALGVRVVDLPGTPVRLLAFCAGRLPLSAARPLLSRALGRGRGGKMPSFHADLHGGGGKSEIGYYHGAVVREAAAQGIPAPVNAGLVEIFTAILEGRILLSRFRHRPDELLRSLSRPEAGESSNR